MSHSQVPVAQLVLFVRGGAKSDLKFGCFFGCVGKEERGINKFSKRKRCFQELSKKTAFFNC